MVRTDLSLPQQVVQAAHAAFAAGAHFQSDPHLSLSLCGVKGRWAIQEVAEYLDQHGIPHVDFHEPDLGGALTALATGPLTDEGRVCLRHLKPWRYHT